MIGERGQHLIAGTFHSIFARLMRQEGRNIDLDPNFTIMDTDDRRKLIRSILKEMGVTSSDTKPSAVEYRISDAKNSLISPEDYLKRARRPIEYTTAKVYEIYQRRIRKMNGLDFDDLLIRPLEAFENFPNFLDRLRNRFRYVMVDEYQDTNRVQYLLVKAIAEGSGNICVVGDDDQAIYGWRGATVRNILDFKTDWPETKIIKLEQNYRSTKPILDTAWSVIHHNVQRHPKKLWTEREQGELIEVISAPSDEAEALRFVAVIDDLHRLQKIPYNHFAILYRTNSQSLLFEQALRSTQIPYSVIGGLRFYERKEIKDILAYLRVILNPADDVSLMRIINYPPRLIGKSLVEELLGRARADDISMSEALMLTVQEEEIPLRQQKALREFVRLLESFRGFANENSFSELVVYVVSEIGMKERLTKEDKDDPSRAESKRENIDTLITDVARFAESSPDGTLLDFLEQVALVADTDSLDETKDRINLLTIHSAKGLEFPVVLVGGLEEGLLPLNPPDGSDPDVQEERRLFYVAATRAMDRLYLGNARSRMRWGTTHYYESSRFLDEIPKELQKNGISPKSAGEPIRRNVPRKPRQQSSFFDAGQEPVSQTGTGSLKPDQLSKGLLVRHPTFGLGIIVSFQNLGQESRIKVDFDDVGEKMLVLKFARLVLER
ncbi:MAG: UvrD-helicase domain-containing protein [Calditrichaeota bacterium]|jgi:DNA helicase II / ATP-dependent DNA helicase PcrA|nr:UvrD-helicase domain-containing protein [Calditrichota bacterium]MBT7617377.1 UvrD-helicase domain-containing protein [Calditrichota bacterium]